MRHSTRRRQTSLRVLIGGLAALMAAPAIAQTCVQDAERAAFDVRALQSKLMVVALACGQDNAYNAFVRRHQGDLAASYNRVQGYFRRSAGSSHQRELDGFITQMANAHSQEQIRAGSQYCPMMAPLFALATAQPNVQALAAFSQERNVLNPLGAQDCAEAAAAPAGAAARAPQGQRPAAR